MIKNTENQWSKLLFLQTSLKSIILHDAFLTENKIPSGWLFIDFYKLLRFSLTFYKIPWLFPDLENFCFSLTFSWPWQPRWMSSHSADETLQIPLKVSSVVKKKNTVPLVHVGHEPIPLFTSPAVCQSLGYYPSPCTKLVKIIYNQLN